MKENATLGPPKSTLKAKGKYFMSPPNKNYATDAFMSYHVQVRIGWGRTVLPTMSSIYIIASVLPREQQPHNNIHNSIEYGIIMQSFTIT